MNKTEYKINPIDKNHTTRHILLYLLTFLGISAIAVATTLIVSGGEFLGIQSASGKMSFKILLISSALLFLVFGLLPCLLVFSLLHQTENVFAEKMNLFKDMHWAWSAAIYVAITLILWVFVQMIFLGDAHWIYWFYLLLASVIIFIALIPGVRNLYKK